MDAAAMERMAKHYWALWGAGSGAGVRSGWPAVHGGGGGEPSWEEQAFAQDAAGHLGGCVWPPRSYTCSFCRREFRSAQALGGHMNVHRRDRARLRQCDDDDAIQQPIVNICAPPPLPLSAAHQLPAAAAADSPLLLQLSSPKSTPPGDHHQDQQQLQGSSTANSSSTSCIATIINERRNRARLFITMPATADHETTDLGLGGDYGKDKDEDSVEENMRKRRRIDQALTTTASCEREVRRREDDPVPEDANKVITSPSSSILVHQLAMVGRQEVDLELRLGTSTPA